MVGDVAYLHPFVDMQTIDVAARLCYAGQSTLQEFSYLTDGQHGFRLSLACDRVGIQLLGVENAAVATTVVVVNQVACNGDGQCRQCAFHDGLGGAQQFDEHILNDVFSQLAVVKT